LIQNFLRKFYFQIYYNTNNLLFLISDYKQNDSKEFCPRYYEEIKRPSKPHRRIKNIPNNRKKERAQRKSIMCMYVCVQTLYTIYIYIYLKIVH